MRSTAYARALGLLIGVPVSVGFVLNGSGSALEAGSRARPPVITAGETGALKVTPARVIELPRGSTPAQARLLVTNPERAATNVAFSAIAPGSGAERYVVVARVKGRRIFHGPPSSLRDRGTDTFPVGAGKTVSVRMTVRLRAQETADEEPRSFALQWTTRRPRRASAKTRERPPAERRRGGRRKQSAVKRSAAVRRKALAQRKRRAARRAARAQRGRR